MASVLTPARAGALLRWLDAARPHVRARTIEAARTAVLNEDPLAYALCADVRGAYAFAGGDIAVREQLGYFDAEDDTWHELTEALLDLHDLADTAGDDQHGRSVTYEGVHIFWERQREAYLHALNVAGLDREALAPLLERALFAQAGLRRALLAAHTSGRPAAHRRTRSARTPCRTRVLATPAPSNAPPTGRAMPALSHAPP